MTYLARTIAIAGGLLCGVGPFLAGYVLGWRVDVIGGYAWPLLLFPLGIPIMVAWFRLVVRSTLFRPRDENDWLDHSGRWATTCYAWFCFLLVPMLFFHITLGGLGVLVGIAVGAVLCFTFLRPLQRLDWIETINPDFENEERRRRYDEAPIRAFLQEPLVASIGTLAVAGLLAWPDYRAIVAGSPEPQYLWGYMLGRLAIAFGIGGVLAHFVGSGWLSFQWRLNVAALVVGILSLQVISN